MSYKTFILLVLSIALTCAVGCSSASQKPKAYTIKIKNMQFVPNNILVNKGDTIKWVNEDIVAHNVTEYNSRKWTSGSMAPNVVWKLVVTDSADYYCSIHAVMKGKIRLTK